MTKPWDSHKDVIIKLYKTEGMTLEQVKKTMIRKYGFRAGIRTYRIHLKKWNVRKYRKHAGDISLSSWRHPHRSSAASPPSDAKSAQTPDFGPHFMAPSPHTVIQRPWPDALDVFHPSAWADRSPSVSASDYSACSVYDTPRRIMESGIPVAALSDSGHSSGQEQRLERDFTLMCPPGGMWDGRREY